MDARRRRLRLRVAARRRTDIAGATSATYTLQPADVGKLVRVKVTATNVDGTASATSAATARVAAPPVNTVAPAAPSGTPRETSTLTAAPGTWDTPGASFSYTWLRCAADATAITASCEEIGAGSTYTLSAADVGRRIGVRVTATSSGGSTAADSALTGRGRPARAAQSHAAQHHRHRLRRGDADRRRGPLDVPVARDHLRLAALRRRRQRPTARRSAAAARSTRWRADDADHTIVLVVTATTPGQSATAQSAPLAIRARPVPRAVGAPTVTGTAKRARTLRAGTGTWTNAPTRFSYQWLRCDGASCQEIAGATADSYLLTDGRQGLRRHRRRDRDQRRGHRAPRRPRRPPRSPPRRRSTPACPVIPSPSPLIQQGADADRGRLRLGQHAPTPRYSLAWQRCERRRLPADRRRHRRPVHAARRGRRLHDRRGQHRHERRRLGLRPLRRDRRGDVDGRPALEDAAADLQQPRPRRRHGDR